MNFHRKLKRSRLRVPRKSRAVTKRLPLREKQRLSPAIKIYMLNVGIQTVKRKIHSLEKRTRAFGKASHPRPYIAFVDPDRCVGCGTCREVCPAGAITVQETANIDRNRCTGCGDCLERCPADAITLQPLNKDCSKAFRGDV